MVQRIKKAAFSVNPNIVFKKEGSNALLFNAKTGKLDTLNETGIFLWKLLNSSNTETEIIEKVACKYRGGKEQIIKDVKSFIRKMLNL